MSKLRGGLGRLGAVLVISTFLFILVPCIAKAEKSNDPTWTGVNTYYWGERKIQQMERPKAKKRYKIGFSAPHLKSPLWVDTVYGAIDESKKIGVDVVVVAAKGYNDLQTQINQFENLVSQGCDAIIIGAISFEGNVPSVEEAVKKGKYVVNVAQGLKTKAASGVSVSDDYQLGVANAMKCIEHGGGKGNVVILSGPSGASWSMNCSAGANDTLKKYPGMKILAERFCDVDVATSQRIMENLLQAFPNIDYVISLDAIAHGAANAIEAAGKSDKIFHSMAYFLKEGLPYVRKGSIDAGQAVHCVLWGRNAMQLAVRACNGDGINAPIIVNTVPLWVTKDNVDSFDHSTQFAPVGWKVPARTGK